MIPEIAKLCLLIYPLLQLILISNVWKHLPKIEEKQVIIGRCWVRTPAVSSTVLVKPLMVIIEVLTLLCYKPVLI